MGSAPAPVNGFPAPEAPMTGAAAAPATVLVYVGLDLVGDGLIKLPFARALRHAFPAARITWLAGKGKSAYAGPLAPLVRGLIDEVIEEAGVGSHWRELATRPLGGRAFDLVIDTQRRVPTSLILRRLRHRAFVSGAAGYLLSDRRPPAGRGKPSAMIDQLLDLVAAAAGAPPVLAPPPPLDAAWTARASALLPDGPVYVGLAPGAGGRHKCWPLDGYIGLARAQGAAGRVPVFLLGPGETDWHDELADAVPEALFPLQDPSVSEEMLRAPVMTIALGRRLAAAVANDAGSGHILAAAETPLLSLFGPSDPAKFAPRAPRLRILRAQDFGGTADMAAIPVAAAADALDALIATPEH